MHAGNGPMLDDLDVGVGQVLDALDRLGLADNTYVFFCSDNGGAPLPPQQVRKDARDRNHPLAGAKQQLAEGGIRVPFIVRGPGVAAGAVCREPVTAYDLLPTFYALAGGREPLPEEIDGGNMGPILRGGGTGAEIRRAAPGLVFHRPKAGRKESVLRQGDFKLVLIWSGPGRIASRELYDLSTDIGEKNNLAKTMPDKAAAMEAALVGYLEAVNAETAPPPSGPKPKRKPATPKA
jgi:arylsulfatase A-like enzyme